MPEVVTRVILGAGTFVMFSVASDAATRQQRLLSQDRERGKIELEKVQAVMRSLPENQRVLGVSGGPPLSGKLSSPLYFYEYCNSKVSSIKRAMAHARKTKHPTVRALASSEVIIFPGE
jgi:hypothetical protein